MKQLARLGLVALIGTSTYLAIFRIAERKADALAGGGAFCLDSAHPSELLHFGGLIEQLQRWRQGGLAQALTAVQEAGNLWIAPHLGGDRSAIYVSSLGLVARIYVRSDELVERALPFPGLNVSDAAQREFASVRLAGTLFHELQHYNGLEDEGATYDREIDWYRSLRQGELPALVGEPARSFEWAVASAIESARVAREKATGVPASATRP